jgi:prepilin-type N-terminal cleavage/methylation domain-containing protein
MSTADLLPGGRRRRDRGYTAIEMAITMVILALMTLVIERTVTGLTDTERTMRAVRTTAQVGQEACYRLRDLVATSRKLYCNDALGNGYNDKVDRTRFPLFPSSRLPTVDEVNPLGPDEPGDPRTGNVLLFVRELDPVPCVAVAATKKIRMVDTYRLVSLYLSQSDRTLVAGGLQALDLVEWRGQAYPSYAQVSQISIAAEKTNTVKELYNRYGFDYLWDPTQPVASAFYAIDGNGVIAAVPTAVTTIPEDMNVSRGGRFVHMNVAVARTDLTSRPRTPMFSVEPIATWTPHGFEVKAVGASGSRKVWMRLTVEQQAVMNRVPAQQTTIVTNTRDL